MLLSNTLSCVARHWGRRSACTAAVVVRVASSVRGLMRAHTLSTGANSNYATTATAVATVAGHATKHTISYSQSQSVLTVAHASQSMRTHCQLVKNSRLLHTSRPAKHIESHIDPNAAEYVFPIMNAR
jgi:hypothetical protein